MCQKNNLEILLVIHMQIFHITEMVIGLLSIYAKIRNNKREKVMGKEGNTNIVETVSFFTWEN